MSELDYLDFQTAESRWDKYRLDKVTPSRWVVETIRERLGREAIESLPPVRSRGRPKGAKNNKHQLNGTAHGQPVERI